MAIDISLTDLPDKYAAKLQDIAARKGMSEDEVVAEIMKMVLDLAENHPDKNDDFILRQLRCTLAEKFGSDSK